MLKQVFKNNYDILQVTSYSLLQWGRHSHKDFGEGIRCYLLVSKVAKISYTQSQTLFGTFLENGRSHLFVSFFLSFSY